MGPLSWLVPVVGVRADDLLEIVIESRILRRENHHILDDGLEKQRIFTKNGSLDRANRCLPSMKETESHRFSGRRYQQAANQQARCDASAI